jgi:DNA-binding response OmpR family regulator
MVVAFQGNTGRPRLLLAYANSAQAARLARYFRRLGWEVHMAPGAIEARRLTDIYGPQVIILEAALAEATGLLPLRPEQRLILLAEARTPQADELVNTTGAAAIVLRGDGMENLLRAVYGHDLAQAV